MINRNRIGTNTGHGHAWMRPDGMKARCCGPGICAQCSQDAILVRQWEEGKPVSAIEEAAKAERAGE